MRVLLPLLLLLVPGLSGGAGAQDALVIAPKAFWGAAAEWRAFREKQGRAVALREPQEDLVAQVRAAAKASAGRLRFVLLLGDADQVACSYRDGVVIQPYERDPRIATDAPLADLDGDGLPDLAVGRLPADDAGEARSLLAKSIAYEGDADEGPWRRRVNVIAGVGGFGALQDWALEQVATKFLTENVPPDLDLHVTYGNPASPFCPPPARIGETALERFNEGALVVAYLGHGSRTHLDRLLYQGQSYEILDDDAVLGMESRHGTPVALLVACSAGHFDRAPDCLAEYALKRPKGPVAVVASSRVSMPYANGVFAKEMLDAFFLQRVPTLGEAVQQAKRRLVVPVEGDEGRRFIEMLAMGYQFRDDLRAKERAEHVFLYNLLGDPLLRVALPAEATLSAPGAAHPGDTVEVSGTTTLTGTARIELVAARTAVRPSRSGDREEDFRRCYEEANDWVKAAADAAVAGGAFRARLALPSSLPKGAYFLRAFVSGGGAAAIAALPLRIE